MLERHAIGITSVGEDLVVVRASVRAGPASRRVRVSWASVRLGPGAGPAEIAGLGSATGPRALIVALDSMLRREVDSGGQSSEAFREVVAENLSSFVPSPEGEPALWDSMTLGAAGGRRAFVGAVAESSIEPTLSRLEALGLAPTRIAPSSLAYPLLRLAREAEPGAVAVDEASEVLEITPTGWSLHRFDGLTWSGSRSGAGAAPSALAQETRRRGALIVDWTGQQGEPAEGALAEGAPTGAERVALGGALLCLWPGVDSAMSPRPSFNLLADRSRAPWIESRFVRWAGLAAAVTIGATLFANARLERATAEAARLEAAADAGRKRVESVERAREQNERMQAAHDRVRRLESTYMPRWLALAELSRATPAGSWVERAEIGDDWVYLDVVSASAADLIQALEEHAAFEGVRQSTPGVATDVPGESKFRIEARLTRAPGAAAGEAGAGVAGGGQ